MSTSDPDPARAPRAPETPPAPGAPTGRFTRTPATPNAAGDPTRLEIAGDALDPVFPQEGDVWSHEVGTRRFEPSSLRGEYPVDASIVNVSEPGPSRLGPSIATKAFEQRVPAPTFVDTSSSPSAFVTDALSELAAEDDARSPAPPRRTPGSASTPPPGFSGS